MAKDKIPSTPAVRALRATGAPFSLHTYEYLEHGGTKVAAAALGVDEHQVIKTLVMQDDDGRPLLVLMHGDCFVSEKALARALKVKGVGPCDEASVTRHTGYQVGGVSPFGTRKALAVYLEKSIADLPVIFINAGRRGLLARMDPAHLIKALGPTLVEVSRDK